MPISTAMCVLAEIIASDVSLVTFNHAIDGVLQNNPKARANPKRWRTGWTQEAAGEFSIRQSSAVCEGQQG